MKERLTQAGAWIKAHAGVLLAVGVGLFAAYYLIFRPSGSSGGGSGQGLTSVSFPPGTGASGGGDGGGGSAPPPSSPPSTPTLPYNPDWSLVKNITDQALANLVDQEYALEEQINQATLSGNTSLLDTLNASLSSIQQQIQNYQPAPSTNPSNTPQLPDLSQVQGFIDQWTQTGASQGWNNSYYTSLFTQTFGLSADVAAKVRQWSEAYKNAYNAAPPAAVQLTYIQDAVNGTVPTIPGLSNNAASNGSGNSLGGITYAPNNGFTPRIPGNKVH